MPIISPTIGRKVWYWPVNEKDVDVFNPAVPLDATVIYPWGDGCVNLRVTDHGGRTHFRASALLVQPGYPVPTAGSYATWMPYQVGQAAKDAAPAADTRSLHIAMTEHDPLRPAGA